VVVDQEEFADLGGGLLQGLHFLAVERAVVTHLDDHRLGMVALALDPLGQADEFVGLAADPGVHREARAQSSRQLFLGADHHRVAERDDPRRSAPVVTHDRGGVRARWTCPHPGDGGGRGGGVGPVRARAEEAAPANEEDDGDDTGDQRRPRHPQPVGRQRRRLRLALEGELDEAVGEVGQDQHGQ